MFFWFMFSKTEFSFFVFVFFKKLVTGLHGVWGLENYIDSSSYSIFFQIFVILFSKEKKNVILYFAIKCINHPFEAADKELN